MGRYHFTRRLILHTSLFLSIIANAFAKKEEFKNYIDFQVRGVSIAENQQSNDYSTGLLWTATNIETDFNFNKYIAVKTITSLLSRVNGSARPHALRNQLNGNGSAPGTFFDNHGFASRVLALAIRDKNTELLIGKIRPNVGIGNNMNSNFNNDWYGLYGAVVNGAYTNSNKIGLQLHANLKIFKYSEQILEVSLFKNDTTDMDNSAFAGNRTIGYSMPYELGGILNKRIAGDTKLPSSFSVFLVNKTTLPNNNRLNYALTYRKQVVDSSILSFVKNENTFLTSAQYEKDNVEGSSTLGVFGELGSIGNAHGIDGLHEYYFTIAGYFSFDRFTAAAVYNLYKMKGSDLLDVSKINFTQKQISFGYKFNSRYKIQVAYRSIKDLHTGKSGNGGGIGFFYDFGTNLPVKGRSIQTIL